ncbi:hypothetical protein Glove_562g3 [Diversispora epigaea]|uniref:Prolyl 4-hydroxylase alpha subunit domain-containing protein n=1 Tax=Diversispora epigaea TaxID=1348612 RepID=A0A397GGA4_9GLOM|nr:hypothetical protein Glove_562g3 [Diversispora epigaea]
MIINPVTPVPVVCRRSRPRNCHVVFATTKNVSLKRNKNQSILPVERNELVLTAPIITLSINDISQRLSTPCIIFNPNQHRTQWATRGLSLKEVKSKEKISVEELLIETLIREARLINSKEQLDIRPDFLTLIDDEIIKGNHISKVKYRTDNLNEHLWLSLGLWLRMKEPLTRREVRQHLRRIWKKLKHAMELRNNIESQDASTTPGSVHFLNKITERISQKTNQNVSLTPLIHLEELNNPNAITKVTNAINNYYFHTLNHPSHRSNNFWENFIEHFGVYTRNNLLPFTNSNTASSYNVEHQECVNILLQNLDPLSICINEFVREYYGGLYEKLRNLTWGPFAPRTFGVFPMITINYNTISDFHWYKHDEPNSLCCLVALGNFEGGELCFPQLQIVIPLRPGQVVAFSSCLLLHDLKNQIERDSHGSVVSMISQQDLNNARNLNKWIRFLEPKKHQIEDLTYARLGLKAEDQIPSLKLHHKKYHTYIYYNKDI